MAISSSIDQIAVQLASAFNAADSAKLASLYTETATLMPPNERAVQGRIAIQAWFQAALVRLGEIQIIPMRSSILGGGVGFQVGNFIITPKDGSSPRAFKYVLILHRVEAQWQIAYDIWNSDQPSSTLRSY
jgi:ketosteroid isomerase-like protein